ncbi:hypothetical protein [Streptomyces uncialis]|uniref:hypothetical protein n=1 Tax=Streptomyces uncialis TaxID=1048205 RepID=UPI0038638BE2|nr:hypothetical protein OG268_00325 [Streptomyces uncialis]
MTGPRPLPGRSLRTRLALFYAAGVFLAGVVVLAVVTLPLVGIQSTVPAHRPGPSTITGTGHGIGPHQLLTGSAVALAVLVPVALVTGWFVAGRFLARCGSSPPPPGPSPPETSTSDSTSVNPPTN